MKKILQSPGSLQNSSTKRIIETVQNLLNQDQDLIIHEFQNIQFSPEIAKNIVTNAQKLEQLMGDPIIRNQINQFMWKIGYGQIQAIIKLTLIVQNSAQFQFELLEDDIIDVSFSYQVFKRFGSIVKVQLKGSYAFIKFSDNVSAFFAQRCLDGHNIRQLCLTLKVQFLPPKLYQQNLQDYLIGGDVHVCNQKMSLVKHTCRYQIQIENEKEFQVARKIIGPKGINMKKIIDSCISHLGADAKNCNDIVKLRLRGKGSGYRQGPSRMESDQNLHLCISSKYQSAYGKACCLVEQLLTNIYNDYRNFCIKLKKQQKQLVIKKLQAGKTLTITQNNENKNYSYQNQHHQFIDKLNEFEVNSLIEARNKARKQSNFYEADRIRNYLRLKGIILTDQKGGRGKGVDVTTWKYIKFNKQFMHENE